jgi:DNA end-binding protein Ku
MPSPVALAARTRLCAMRGMFLAARSTYPSMPRSPIMPRPVWSGTLSFGLLNVPVSLMSGERNTDIHFRMLDARNKAPIRYERVNADTGEEVPWKDIVRAFEYDKGSYVVIEREDIEAAAPESHDAVEIEAFIPRDAIGPRHFEKPYVLVPAKKAEKGYVLLRETLARTQRIGVARVVIRTREHLAAVIPEGDALVLVLLRYPQELVSPGEYHIPEGKPDDYRITPREMKMAEQLIESMSEDWQPDDYRDEFRERLQQVIAERMKQPGATVSHDDSEEAEPEGAATNVVDFMALLQKSLAANARTPAKKVAEKTSGKSAKHVPAEAKGKAREPAATKRASKRASTKRAPAKSTPGKRQATAKSRRA